jgi:bifunctional isochorismate lyase/aryl carrier protein
MKEPYFTTENITARATGLLLAVEQYRREPPRSIAADRTALIVLDMQRYFLEEGSHAFVPSAPAIIPRVGALVDAFQKIVLTRHVNTRQNAGMLGRWWRDLIKKDDPLGGLDPRIDSSRGRTLVKTQYDAFHDTPLGEILDGWGVRNLVVCGVMTHLCCETTARSAFVRGYSVFLPVDATATYTEELHRASLLTLAHGFATPLLTEELIQMVGGER